MTHDKYSCFSTFLKKLHVLPPDYGTILLVSVLSSSLSNHFMNEYNCGAVFGSLVHRARGYKRLRDEVIMSSIFRLSSMNTPEDRTYGIVTSHTPVEHARYSGRKFTLLKGTLVVVVNTEKRSYLGDAVIKIITEVETKLPCDLPDCDIFWCPEKVLAILEQKIWNLIAAVPCPEERIRLIQDVNLLNELSSIEIEDIVRIESQSRNGIVTNKCPKPELGPGIFFEVILLDNDEIPSYMKSERCDYFPVSDLRPCKQMCPSKKSRESHVTKKRNEFVMSDQYYPSMDMRQSDNCSTYGSESCKSNRFSPGDRIVWLSEAGDKPGTICWRSSLSGNKLQVHLGSECKETNCTRARTNLISINEIITEDEFNRKKLNVSQSRNMSSSNNNVRVDDLLGIDQLDNCMKRTHSFGNVSKDYGDELKFGLDDIKRSFNITNRGEIPLSSDENLSSMDELGIGSMVEVSISGEPHYGVIKFIGPIIYKKKIHNTLFAGIEMEEENRSHYNDSFIDDVKYFECAPYRGYFTPLERCKKDSRFQDSPHPYTGEAKTPEDYGKPVIPGVVEPISQLENIHLLCGKYKGIQGHNNSCYLDATLFSMFTFTSVFDDLLYRPANDSDIQQYKEVQRVLREEIVNPLRKNLFVRSDSVMKLRTLLDSLTSVTGLTCEEKDPEEFLTSLVAQVLKAEPYLKLSSDQDAFYYQLFVEKDERLRLPTVQQLFEQSFITSDIKLKEVPSCLIIQMPRFGKSYKMYPRILPSQILDVTDVIENSLRQCSVCGQLAYYECKECFKDRYEPSEWISFCQNCVKKIHLHEKRNHHKYTQITLPRESNKLSNSDSIPRHFMELFAVLCIETSHYVAFVKCGLGPDTPWCFFDSMADRKGGLSGYNIPEMVLCPDLPLWLEEGAQEFCEMKDDRLLDPYAKRLLCDAYMCMYQSTDVMMYR